MSLAPEAQEGSPTRTGKRGWLSGPANLGVIGLP
jgi:hypothetical protein